MSSPKFIRLGSAPAPGWLSSEAEADALELEPATFAPAEFADRVARVRSVLEKRDLAGALVFRPSSVEYLCGHHTVETAPQPVLLTGQTVRLYVPDPEVGRGLAAGTVDELAHYAAAEDALRLISADVAHACGRGERVAVEHGDTSVPPRTIALLEDAGLAVESGNYLVENLRLILSPAEIGCMERAAETTALGVEAAYAAAAEGDATDSSVAAAIGQALRAEADSSAAMDVIVATGPRGGVPHSTFRNVPLSQGTTFIEFAGTHHRYHAPVMVTVAREVDSVARRLEKLSQTMLAAVLKAAVPGRAAGEVARTVQAVLEFESRDAFHFNFGYAIGLAHPPGWLDSAPFSIVAENEDVLEEGMAFHVPGSLRSFAECGVGLSHSIVLESAGPRVLTGGSRPAIRVLNG